MTKIRLQTKTNIVNNNDLEKRVFKIVALSFGIVAILYIYFLAHTVFNVLAKKNLEVKMKSVATDVSNLELQYMSKDNSVDMSYAKGLGFVESSATSFANRENVALSSSLLNNEI